MVGLLVKMIGETWHVSSKVFGGLCQPRLCGNLWSCGCVPTLERVSLFNELILGWQLGSTHIVNRTLMLMNPKYMMLCA
jgi:hypothetical protein